MLDLLARTTTPVRLSVCQRCEQAIGLIVSQDGEVKAVKADGGRLMFWDGILEYRLDQIPCAALSPMGLASWTLTFGMFLASLNLGILTLATAYG